MSIPDLILEGYRSEDWGKISEAYRMLTGVSLTNPEEKTKPDHISSAKSTSSPATENPGGAARREPMDLRSERPQLFVDDGTIASNERVSERPDLGVANPVRRDRQTPEKTEVTCSVCGKTETILSSLAENLGTYRCNGCCVNK